MPPANMLATAIMEPTDPLHDGQRGGGGEGGGVREEALNELRKNQIKIEPRKAADPVP